MANQLQTQVVATSFQPFGKAAGEIVCVGVADQPHETAGLCTALSGFADEHDLRRRRVGEYLITDRFKRPVLRSSI